MSTIRAVGSNRDVVSEILGRLDQPEAKLLDLLEAYHKTIYELHWHDHVELYHAFARRLISTGHPARAIELIREGLEHHPDDLELKYRMALAFARGGNISQAAKYIQELLAITAMPLELWVEVLSLQGNYYKNRYRRTRDPAARKELAGKSAHWYRQAFEGSGKLFPLINYATMTALADGPPGQPEELAREVLKRAKTQGPDSKTEAPYWFPATLAEAHIILCDFDNAFTHLREAITLAKDNTGDIGAMRLNLLLLQEKVQNETGWEKLLAQCEMGSVMVFAGHMIDAPTNYRGRFPTNPPLVFRVQQAIRTVLEDKKVTVGYCSASCGSDLLFAEEVLNRGGELHVVLPFGADDFVKTSVDFGLPEMLGWRKKYDMVLRRAKQVHPATEEAYLGDDILFEFLNTVLHGLALIRAGERGVDAHALVVVDQTLPPEQHGTFDFIRKWQDRTGREPAIIKLAELRQAVNLQAKPERLNSPAAYGTQMRHIKAMLFADVKGFSKLPEHSLHPFFDRFTKEVRKIIDTPVGAAGRPVSGPTFINTWGDGLFMVFEDVVPAADFALRLLEEIQAETWDLPPAGAATKAEPLALALRIGLHTGPVYEYTSPLLDRTDYFGSHVNRAARIEPVTLPGCAYASEQFAAALAVRSGHDFACEFVGIENLAKDYDRCPLYRLVRR
jgi:class 3 adenylate cyclase/tetratricopeptide (TPR) repeat protein